MNLPERIALLRRYGLFVSDDGFMPTPTGPVHIDDSEMCRALLAHDELLAACRNAADQLDRLNEERMQTDMRGLATMSIADQCRAAVALAKGGAA